MRNLPVSDLFVTLAKKRCFWWVRADDVRTVSFLGSNWSWSFQSYRVLIRRHPSVTLGIVTAQKRRGLSSKVCVVDIILFTSAFLYKSVKL